MSEGLARLDAFILGAVLGFSAAGWTGCATPAPAVELQPALVMGADASKACQCADLGADSPYRYWCECHQCRGATCLKLDCKISLESPVDPSPSLNLPPCDQNPPGPCRK